MVTQNVLGCIQTTVVTVNFSGSPFPSVWDRAERKSSVLSVSTRKWGKERGMFAQMKHLAIVSDNLDGMSKFYQTLFGMKGSGIFRAGALVVGDGYVGLNINLRVPGRQAGFDHFGFEVQDVELVFSRLRSKYPSIRVLKRLGNRPFAGISTHDPAGNVFDLSQSGMENRADVYLNEDWSPNRYVKHFVLRVLEPAAVGEFYRDVLELRELEKPSGNLSYYLSDGRITLVVSPWMIDDFAGTGIERPAPEHIGFKVESLAAFKKDLEALKTAHPELAPRPMKAGPEGEARLRLFARCPYGELPLADPDGVLIDVSERP
jgi:catechol 2,3-dioxygenase-like lactoylglutathione lyase family enzyme